MGQLTQAAADLAGIFTTDGFGQVVTYTPVTGSQSSFTAIVVIGEDLEDGNWKAALQATARIFIRASDVASPDYRDTVTIAGVTWTVAQKISYSGGMWHLELRRDLRPSFPRG